MKVRPATTNNISFACPKTGVLVSIPLEVVEARVRSCRASLWQIKRAMEDFKQSRPYHWLGSEAEAV
jgi:hypothetical protein